MKKKEPIHQITKRDFLNYFKCPQPFWFLLPEEIDTFFMSEKLIEELNELSYRDQMRLLREIVESPKALLANNFLKLNRLKNQRIVDFYRKKFKLPNLSLYDYGSSGEDATEQVLQILRDSKRTTVFFYKPTLVVGDVKIKPTALYKYGGKVYLIEHFWSTTLKQEAMAHLAFYNYFFTKLLGFKIDQYLLTYLLAKPFCGKELLVEVTNSLPFTSKVRTPEGPGDEKMKNVNSFFGLSMDYPGTLYERLFDREAFDSINNEPWELFDEEIVNPEKALEKLREFIENPSRDLDFYRLSEDFLRGKSNMVGPTSNLYKSIFAHLFPPFNFSSSIMPLVNSLLIIRDCPTEEQRNIFLDYTSNLNFLTGFPKDQDYILFPEAIACFEDLKNKRVKVYYDFETVSLPFPYFDNTKPYAQIVLQLSLIVVRDNVEQKPATNIILDPLELSIDSFKRIIDAIYVDEEDVAYVVYNRSFENTRLKEMAELINEDEYGRKVTEIIDRTIDLANWFTYGNSPRIIHRKLKGFHSIKKVNKLIPKDIELATGTKKYSDLSKCQNGIMAQAMLLSRALVTDSLQDEHNWMKNKEFMHSYCENDVRSMMAVELYIGRLIEENRYDLFDPEKFRREKLRFKRLKAFSRI